LHTTYTLVAFLSARTSNGLTNSMLTVAVGWHLYSRSGDPFDLALVGLMQIIPVLGLFFVTGLVIDTANRRSVLVVCTLADTLVLAALAALLSSGYPGKLLVFVLLLAHGVTRAFIQPAQQALLPNLVAPHLFPRAVALSSTMLKVATTLGPIAAGLAIALAGFATYWVISGISLLGAVAYRLLPNPAAGRTARRTLSDVLAGIRYIGANPIVLGAITLDLFAVLFGSVMGLLPVFAIDILAVGPDVLGVMRAMPAIGAVLAGIALARMPPLRHAGQTLFAVLLLFGVSILVFGWSRNLYLSLAALFVYGGVDMISVNIRLTLIQIATPDALRGRVSAVNSLFTASSNELGDFRSGSMAALVGPVPSVVIGGMMTLGVAWFGWIRFTAIRQLDRLDHELR
jgi:MFS family permease